ncbi:MAG: hypothetical protein ACRD1G_20165, partial [Acidimicrobiales bacterium]
MENAPAPGSGWKDEGWIQPMAKISTYRLDSYGRPPEAVDAAGGIFQLSDAEWRLLFSDSRSGVTCGLLRSQLEVEPVSRRRCRVVVRDDFQGGFRATFVVRARARRVRSDLRDRLKSLRRSREVMAAVDAGQWWRDVRSFDGAGGSLTRSVAGVGCQGGRWESGRVKRTRLARVLDLGPKGVSLRGWRTRLTIPWDTIAGIEVVDGRRESAADYGRSHGRFRGTAIVVRSHTEQE